LTPTPTQRRSDPREVAGLGPSAAFSKPKEGKPKQGGRKFKGKGSEIQKFTFRQSRLFNGLNRNSKKKAISSMLLFRTSIPDPTHLEHSTKVF
jgi:hypothetical protein